MQIQWNTKQNLNFNYKFLNINDNYIDLIIKYYILLLT